MYGFCMCCWLSVVRKIKRFDFEFENIFAFRICYVVSHRVWWMAGCLEWMDGMRGDKHSRRSRSSRCIIQ